MRRLRTIVAGALMLSAPALAPCAVGQVVVSPASVEVSLAAGERGEAEAVVTNEGAVAVDLFAVPMPEGGMPEDVGEVLLASTEANDPYGLAMTPGGRIFAADYSGHRTWEYTLELGRLPFFEHPHAGNNSRTLGLAWMPPEHTGHPEGTLWWMDTDADCSGSHCTVVGTLLIEGDLDGNVTGRTIELVTGPGIPGPISYDRGLPTKLAYDAEGADGAGLFYYLDGFNDALYAITVDGEVAESYPVDLIDFDSEGGGDIGFLEAGLNAVRGADGELYLDLGVVLPGEQYGDARVAVTDRWGRATGAETPLTRLEPPDGQGGLIRAMDVLRSRLDPSVMYLSVITGIGTDVRKWVVAIRAHPLPPRWLRVSPVAPRSLEIAPGETDTLTVRLSADGMEPGVYAGQVALRAGGPNGEEVASVPVTLTVTPGVDTEDGAEPEEASWLAVYPNPATASATVALTLEVTSEVRVVVYDVLGRAIAVLHVGPLGAGEHALTFESAHLPAGLYLVRAEGSGFSAAQRVTVVR